MTAPTQPSTPPAAGTPAVGRIDPALLAFDIDGVVANTMRLFLEIVRERYGINHIRLADITSYNLEDCLDLDNEVIMTAIRILLDGDYTQTLQPLPGSRRVLMRMARVVPRLLFVTARPNRDVIGAWMQALLDSPPTAVEVVATGSFEAKRDVLQAAGMRYFVEDRLETCFQLAEAGLTPIVYRQPWNRQPHPFCEVDGWAAIERLLDFPPGD